MRTTRLRLAAVLALGSAVLTPAVSSAGNCSKSQPLKGEAPFNGETFLYQAKCKGDWNVILTLTLNGADFTASYSATEDVTNRQCDGQMHSPSGGLTDLKQQKGSCVFDRDHAVKVQVKRK